MRVSVLATNLYPCPLLRQHWKDAVAFCSDADVNRNIFKYTPTLRQVFTCRLKTGKNQEIKTTDCSVQSLEPIKVFLATYKKNFMTQRTTTYINSELSQRHTVHKPCLSRDKSNECLSREMMPIQPNFTGAFRVVTAGLLPQRKTWGKACMNQQKAPLWN